MHLPHVALLNIADEFEQRAHELLVSRDGHGNGSLPCLHVGVSPATAGSVRAGSWGCADVGRCAARTAHVALYLPVAFLREASDPQQCLIEARKNCYVVALPICLLATYTASSAIATG